MITIRDMRPEDLPWIMEIERSCFTSDAWSEDMFLYAIESEGYCSLTAECGGELAGYAVSTRFIEANIDSIAVAEGFRRQGIAERLIKACLNGFKGDVFLEVRKSNAAAEALYKKLGFSVIAVRKNYYDRPAEDALIMKAHM